jgi:RNA polymerase sigma-70 factor (ECF subfamily)
VSALTRAFRNEPAPASIEEKSTQRIQANKLWEAVQTLKMADQQIVYLRYFLDLSVSETAEALQVAEGTVKSRLNRALKKLRTVIRDDFPVLLDEHEA